MAEPKKEKPKEIKAVKGEKIYTITLTEAYKKALRRRSPYAVRIIKDHVKTHTKMTEVKIGPQLNETIWARGMTRPARRVRVKVITEGTIAKVELMGYDYKDFKAVPKRERQGMKERLMERLGPKALQKETQEKAIEGKAGETATPTAPATKPEAADMNK